MTASEAAALITAIGGLVWPLVGIALLWTLRKRFAAMVDSIVQRGGGVKLAGFEVSVAQVTEQQQGLIADLQIRLAGIEDRLEAAASTLIDTTGNVSSLDTAKSEKSVGTTPIPGEAGNIDLDTVASSRSIPYGTMILWVDGHPEAAAALIDTIEKRGARIIKSLSISDALDQISAREFNVIVARMKIGGRADGGVELTQRMLAIQPLTTIFVFADLGNAERFGLEALVAGAQFVTDSAAELIRRLTRLDS